ncbi:hypothetical protein BSPLISOX_3005 [uncultured Gammaproteobacteria bacterium]|jgi:hypothetical protein|nr:hypothetical protein [uncultured Gammaproteobacteria bacterium]VVH62890.1 hypothetical protein BSPWISOX_2950 [uncultured Gammaproteobacteria bacterium]VVH66156.1 hypothetical protein BSPLISOX_3005 [uncultured Gammaproteobacteria bacterium]
MNKLTRLILVHLSTGIVIVGLFLFFDNVNNQTLPSQLSNYQQVQSIKQQQLIKLQHQLKINEINLVKNIDEVKIFIAANTNKLSLSKVKRTNRGIEYLLSGDSIDILVLLYKATEQRLKIDINRLLFNTQDKLIAEITIVGVEQ